MKKTFTITGYGKIKFTTDICRKHIEESKNSIKKLEWDLENWDDIPKAKIEADIRFYEKAIVKWNNILNKAIEKGYDKELEEV